LGCGRCSSKGTELDTVVTIDRSRQYQIIDGFGGTEHWLFPPASEYSRIFDDLGVSILRFRLLRYTEAVPNEPGNEAAHNDNDDPSVINWEGVNTRVLDGAAPFLKAAQSRGVKLFGNITSPPPWMKTSNLAEAPGSLKAGYEDELVEFILIWLKGMQKYHGVRIDYVNFQNEPNYTTSYPSCYISPRQMQYLTQRLGSRLKAEGIDTKIIPPETSNLSTFKKWANLICQDSKAKTYVHALTTHSYNISFWDPYKHIKQWKKASNTARAHDRHLWLTEYCLDHEKRKGTWYEAITLVQHVHNALVHGNVSAWLYHELYRDPSRTPLALIDKDTEPYPKFYALKQYFHYVRTRAVRVSAKSNDADILATSFIHRDNCTFVILLINRNTSSAIVSFYLNDIPKFLSFRVFRTTSTEKAADLGQVQVTENVFRYTLPRKNITTFVSNLPNS
jgi:O-glycosyl hydrolase